MFFPTAKVECVGSLLISTKDLEEFGAWKPKINLSKRATEAGPPLITPGDAMCHDSKGIARLQKVLTEKLEREKVANLRRELTEKLERGRQRANEESGWDDTMTRDDRMAQSRGVAKLQKVLTEKLEREKVAKLRKTITEKFEQRFSSSSGEHHHPHDASQNEQLVTRDDRMAGQSRGIARLQKVLTESLAPRSPPSDTNKINKKEKADRLQQRAQSQNNQNHLLSGDPMTGQSSGIAKLQRVLTETLSPRSKPKE